MRKQQGKRDISGETMNNEATLGAPSNIGLELHIYHVTRSKRFINFFSKLNISRTNSNQHKTRHCRNYFK